jgi:hypothetical protein
MTREAAHSKYVEPADPHASTPPDPDDGTAFQLGNYFSALIVKSGADLDATLLELWLLEGAAALAVSV